MEEIYPSISLDYSSNEFETDKDRIIYLNMEDIQLYIKVALQKGRFFDDFNEKVF